MFDAFDDKSPSRMPREDQNMRARAGQFGATLVVVALSLLAGITPKAPAIRTLAWLGFGAVAAVAAAYWKLKKRD